MPEICAAAVLELDGIVNGTIAKTVKHTKCHVQCKAVLKQPDSLRDPIIKTESDRFKFKELSSS